ncbi:MAG: hypothetical protein HQL86_01910 [Magnetococcales bacterium]|nr:hypothetical protein [Magnetococcales bacterium]
MIFPERWLQTSLDWLGSSLKRIAGPNGAASASPFKTEIPSVRPSAGEASVENAAIAADQAMDSKGSGWCLQAVRVTLTHVVVRLAELLRATLPDTLPEPQERPASPQLVLYSASGRPHLPASLERSTQWMRPVARGGGWHDPAFRVALSPEGRLAGGAFTSVTAAPGEMDRFVERIRTERQAGFYPATVFEQAREILKKGEEQDLARVSG